MTNSGLRTPATRTTINLAPGGLRKEGPAYDLPNALAIVASMKKYEDAELEHFLIAGELSLSGKTRPVKGTLAMAIADLAGSKQIETPHLLEAIQYRSLDRNLF